MARKILFISLALLLVIGISSADFQQKPKPKKKAKKTEVKKSADNSSAHQGIVWYNMTDGYAKAKKEKKILVVDVYTDWCGWCKVMDKQTYENANVVKKMKKHFVAVKFNPEVNASYTINDQTMNSDQLARYLNKGGRIPGYPMTYVWKTLSDNTKIQPYSGYLDTTVFNTIMNKAIQE
jgi:thiol:disulfide interchange protein